MAFVIEMFNRVEEAVTSSSRRPNISRNPVNIGGILGIDTLFSTFDLSATNKKA